MKKKNALFTSLIVILCCMVACASTTEEGVEQNDRLMEFMLGTWYAEKEMASDGQIYTVQYQVSFMDNKSLRFSKSSALDGFDDKFEYRFIDSDTMVVENARAQDGKWKVTKIGENLQICIWSDNNCLIFTRIVSQ